MYLHAEEQILRALAVTALAAALLVMGFFAITSGVLGGAAKPVGSSEAVAESPGSGEAAQPAAEQQAESPGEENPGEEATSRHKTYVVQEGDSFYTISNKYNASISEIQQLNPNLDPSNLTPGTRVTVP